MNFDFSEDQKLLQRTVHDFLAAECGLEVSRKVMEGDGAFDESVWKGAAEMGLLGTAVPESLGGSGLGHLELALVAEEMGRALAPVPFSSSVYLATEARRKPSRRARPCERSPAHGPNSPSRSST